MTDQDLTAWIETAPLPQLMAAAAAKRDAAFGRLVSYSRKVFIPLTKLCRDVCHYCTFAERPRADRPAYLSADDVLAIARAGAAAGCTEALFTLGDKPELRYRAAREALDALGHTTTIGYLREMCALVLKETSLLPHVNPGVMTRDEIAPLREVSASMGLMLESSSERLSEPGQVHYGSPDKHPAARLETIALAGELNVQFTTGILIGIGETRAERVESLTAIRDLHARHGHIGEVIVQNFRAKPNTKRADAPDPDLDDLLWSIAAARLILPEDVHVQAPPNLSPGVYAQLIDAGIDDWGGVSPVTPDHVNPEAPWPHLDELARRTAEIGKILIPRLPVYPSAVAQPDRWFAPKVATRIRQMADSEGWARDDEWAPGVPIAPQPKRALAGQRRSGDRDGHCQGHRGRRLDESEIVRLFDARDVDYHRVMYRRRRTAPRGQWRHRALRREPQHQLHQHLLLPLQVLRLLQGQDARGVARHAVRSRHGGNRAPRAGSVGSRCHRSVPARRHPSRLHRRHVREHLQGDQGGGARDAHPRVLATGSDAGCGDAGALAAGIPGRTEGGRSGNVARHGCGNPRRRNPRHHLSRQDQHRSNGWTWRARRTRWACAPRPPSCMAMSNRH